MKCCRRRFPVFLLWTVVFTALLVPKAEAATNIDINFDTNSLNTAQGRVGGSALSSYLAGYGVGITNVTPGTGLEVIDATSLPGNYHLIPTSRPNFLTQIGSSQPVTFTLTFNPPLASVSFNRIQINLASSQPVSHPAWTATILDSSNNALEAVSEPLLFSANDIVPRSFTLAGTGNNIGSIRFDSDSQQTADFTAILLDDLTLDPGGVDPISVTLANSGGPYTNPANVSLTASASDSSTNISHVSFYLGSEFLGTSPGVVLGTTLYPFTWSNVSYGTYQVTAEAVDAAGYSKLSAPVTITVNLGPNSTVANFDMLNASNGPVEGATLAGYFSTKGFSLLSNSPAATVAVENQNNVAGGGFVQASSQPNLLTEIGTSGPVSFTVGFFNLLTSFTFTRPELLANPTVTHPAWEAAAYDPVGNILDSVQQPYISSSSNVSSQTYTLLGDGIAAVQFNSYGSGLTTFSAVLLDDFILTEGFSLVITNPLPNQIFTSSNGIPIQADVEDALGTVTSVAFYYNSSTFIGATSARPYTNTFLPPGNGTYRIFAIASDNFGNSVTSAPVVITVANGFAFLQQPVNQAVAQGQAATFSVATTISNGVSYVWNEAPNPVFAKQNAVPGQTNSTFAIFDARPVNDGLYYVVATDTSGTSITSAVVSLFVDPPPTATVPTASPSNITIGDTVTLTETATPIGNSYIYQWQLNGANIGGATNSTFIISNAQPLNSGSYQVNVGDGLAFSQSPALNVSVSTGGPTVTTNTSLASSLAFNPLAGPVAGNNSASTGAAAGDPSQIAGKPAAAFLGTIGRPPSPAIFL